MGVARLWEGGLSAKRLGNVFEVTEMFCILILVAFVKILNCTLNIGEFYSM